MAVLLSSNWRSLMAVLGPGRRAKRKNAQTPTAQQQSMHVHFTYVGGAVHPVGVTITHEELGGTFRVVAQQPTGEFGRKSSQLAAA